MRARVTLLAALVAVLGSLLGVGSAEARAGFKIGFSDGLFSSPSSAERALWLDHAADDADAGIVRVFVVWRSVVAGQPASPRNPADPAYDFAAIDRVVRGASARGLDVLTTVYGAPDWAEGNNRDAGAPAGTWKPRPGDVGDFAFALAKRYSGSFPDPLQPLQSLPRVRYFQDWNEPNLDVYLTPQWKGHKQVAAEHYRKMLNAGYEAVHRVHADNVLVGAGTSPYGDDPGGSRTRPLRFWRAVFCLKDRNELKPAKCPKRSERAHLDVMAHHPINTSGPPTQSAIHPDDVSSPDMGQIAKTIRAAEKHGRVLPARRRPIWVTEFWYESNPPDKAKGLPLKTQARYIEQSMYLFWKAGASAAIALQLRDAKHIKANAGQFNVTGAYFYNGKPKPALRAYRFPFVGDRTGTAKVRLWGMSPAAGKVVIERKRGSKWKRAETVNAGGSQVFTAKIHLRGSSQLRAKAGGERSLVWKQR